jgi:peptidoglycan/LPS O-acetylase OafA/YrhL
MQTTVFSARRVSGVLLALIGGVAVTLGWDWLVRALGAQNENTGAYVLAFTAAWILLAGVGAWLMRTWWALLTIPIAFFVGYMLGAVMDGLMPGNAQSSAYLALGAAIFGIFYLLPLVLVSLIGAIISKRTAR